MYIYIYIYVCLCVCFNYINCLATDGSVFILFLTIDCSQVFEILNAAIFVKLHIYG